MRGHYCTPADKEKKSIRCDRLAVAKLKEEFGKAWLHEISKEHIKAYFRRERVAVSKKTGKKLEGASLNRRLAILKCLFNCAIERGYIQGNPALGVKKAKEAPWRRKYALSVAEVKLLIDHSAAHLKPILALAFGTGLRRSDLLSLTWDQVDFENNVITLRMKKTEEWLEVPMQPMVKAILLARKKEAGESPFVLTYRGERIADVKTAFKTALKRSKLDKKGYHLHDLRRSFASQLFEKKVNLLKIQRLLGHASITTTERYLGVKFRETAEAIEEMDSPEVRALAGFVTSIIPSTSLGGKLASRSSSFN